MFNLTRLSDSSRAARRSALRGLAVLTAAGLLSACGSMSTISADVSSYGQWPQDKAKPRYVFERLPSQQSQADFQSRVEAAAAPELAAKGFVKVASADQADVLVQVAAQSRTVGRYEDPYYRPYDGSFFGTVGFGGIWGGRGGVGIGIQMEPPRSQMQVDVLVRDRRTNQTLYETHAVHQRAGTVVESLMPALFRASLMDFPITGISPRRVTIEAAAKPSSAP